MPNFKYVALAIAEAALVILITQIPIWVRMILFALEDPNATFPGTVSAIYGQFAPGDVLSFAAGILGSSTAYSIMKIGSFRVRPGLTLVLVVAPLVVFSFLCLFSFRA